MSGSHARHQHEATLTLTRLVIVRAGATMIHRELAARFALDPGTLIMFDRRRTVGSRCPRDRRWPSDMQEVLERRGYYVVRYLPGRCCMIRACSSSASTWAARSPI
jgi:hypothetical protein